MITKRTIDRAERLADQAFAMLDGDDIDDDEECVALDRMNEALDYLNDARTAMRKCREALSS